METIESIVPPLEDLDRQVKSVEDFKYKIGEKVFVDGLPCVITGMEIGECQEPLYKVQSLVEWFFVKGPVWESRIYDDEAELLQKKIKEARKELADLENQLAKLEAKKAKEKSNEMPEMQK